MSGPWEKFQPSTTESNPSDFVGKPWERFRQAQPVAPQPEDMGAPDPQVAAYTGEVLSGDPARARRAITRSEFDRMSPAQRAILAADDAVRLTANGLSFGFADKVGGKVSELTGIGPTTAQRRQNTQDARDRAGLAGTVAEVGGSMATMGGAAKAGLTAFRAVPQGAGVGARLVAGGVEGAGYGALEAAGHDQDIGTGASIGALTGVAGQGAAEVVSGLGKAAGQAYKRATGQVPRVPSRDELYAAANRAYKAADDAGVVLSQRGLARMRQGIVDDLTDFGFHPKIQPKAAAALEEINRIAGGNATLKGLDQARKIALRGYGLDKSDNAALRMIVDRIDEHLDRLGAGDVIMGRPEGIDALKQARSLWQRLAKSDAVEQAIARGELTAATNASGGNTENEVRKEIRRLIRNPKASRGWTDDEMAQAMKTAAGTPTQNLLRLAGRLGPQGNGVGLMFGLGGLTTMSPAMLAGSAVGAVAKPVSRRMAQGNAQQLAEIMRAGGTRAAVSGPPNALQRLSETKRQALARALLAGGLSLAPYAVGKE